MYNAKNNFLKLKPGTFSQSNPTTHTHTHTHTHARTHTPASLHVTPIHAQSFFASPSLLSETTLFSVYMLKYFSYCTIYERPTDQVIMLTGCALLWSIFAHKNQCSILITLVDLGNVELSFQFKI